MDDNSRRYNFRIRFLHKLIRKHNPVDVFNIRIVLRAGPGSVQRHHRGLRSLLVRQETNHSVGDRNLWYWDWYLHIRAHDPVLHQRVRLERHLVVLSRNSAQPMRLRSTDERSGLVGQATQEVSAGKKVKVSSKKRLHPERRWN